MLDASGTCVDAMECGCIVDGVSYAVCSSLDYYYLVIYLFEYIYTGCVHTSRDAIFKISALLYIK